MYGGCVLLLHGLLISYKATMAKEKECLLLFNKNCYYYYYYYYCYYYYYYLKN